MSNKHAITQLLHFLLKDEGQLNSALHSGSIKKLELFKTTAINLDLQ